MKNQLFDRRQFAGSLAPVLFAFAAPAMAQSWYRVNGPGTGTPVAVVPVTAEEVRWLAYMREEEKLARDVYEQLLAKWGLSIFRNIAMSEEQHHTAIGTLLVRYSVPDPALNKPTGVYVDAKLAALYSQLMAKGLQSAKDALEVGVLIEKTDIADLEAALKSTVKLDIKRVYTNLMNGSYNHLEAFETTLEITA